MTIPSEHRSERSTSAEYLKEYGGLVVDVSTLIDALDKNFELSRDMQTFSIESSGEPLDVPEQVSKYIGSVESADITYENKPDAPIIVELYGTKSSYRISRYPDVDEHIDTVIDMPPLDSLTHSHLVHEIPNGSHFPLTTEEFNDRIHNVPGIQNADFAKLLMTLANPGLSVPDSPEHDAALSAIDVFSPEIKEALFDATKVSTPVRNGFFAYEFLADNSATLTYAYEHGQAVSFQFTCKNEFNEPIRFSGDMSRSADFAFLQHAETNGMNNDIVDTTISFPLTYQELKYVRGIFADEIASLPDAQSVATTSIETDEVASDTDNQTDEIDLRIENQLEEKRIEQQARIDWAVDQLIQSTESDDKS